MLQDSGVNDGLIGQTVDGRYCVERVLGRGGMGTVYQCKHLVLGKRYAMKVLRPGIERTLGNAERFEREARAASSLRSRHIVDMMDFGQLPNGSLYAVMEFLEGKDLTGRLRGAPMSKQELAHVFRQVAETLAIAHERGIVHRDHLPRGRGR